MIVKCPKALVEHTLFQLREAGTKRCESVTLWLGRRNGNVIDVVEAYRPAQNAKEDMFYIPKTSMDALYADLRQKRLMVAAQVHSHPMEAFHSRADDQWAIIRHEGGLSLVVPFFASETVVSSFLDKTKVYRFSDKGKWTEVPRKDTHLWLQLY